MNSTKRSDGGSGRSARVHVSAFGKHPGWDDHIEEIGLDSDALVWAKRVLYTEGMAGNIDAGAWEKLEPEKRLPGFSHNFYWRTGEGLMIGRMWSSRDGKGRTKYPMVVCAMIEGVPDSWAIDQALPRLAAVEEKCAQTTSAEAVRLAIGEARRALEDAAALLVASDVTGPQPEALLSRLVEHPDMARAQGSEGDDRRVGFVRVLYEIEREMGPYRPSGPTTRGRTKIADPPAQHLRVRKGLTGPGEAARAWLVLLDQEISPTAKVLVIEPRETDFLDIIVGEPKPPQLFSVRAGEKALGLTSDVPYTMEPTFRADASAKLDSWAKGQAAVISRPESTQGPAETAKSGKRRLIAVAAAVLVVAVVIAAYLISRGGADSSATPPLDEATGNGTKPSPAEPKTAVATAPKTEPKKPQETVKPKNGGAPLTAAGVDPRTAWSANQEIARAAGAIDQLENDLAAENAKPDPALRDKLERIKQRVTIVRAMSWSPANQEAVTRDLAAVDGEIADVNRHVAEAKAALAGRVRTYLEQLAQTPPVRSDVMKRAWTNGLARIDPATGWTDARARVTALSESLNSAEQAIGEVAPIQVPAGSAMDAGSIRIAVEAAHDKALDSASAAAAAGETERVVAAATQYREWLATATQLVNQGAQIERQLKDGYGSSEAAAGGKSLADLAESVRGLAAYRELGGAVGPLVRDVEQLAAIETEASPPALQEALRGAAVDSSGRRVAEGLAAWSSLARADWPTDAAGLTAAGETFAGPVRTLIARVAEPPRRAVLEERAIRDAESMWLTFTAKHAGAEAGLVAAMEARPVLKVGDGAISKVPPWARYNVLLLSLKQAADRSEAMEGEEKATAQRASITAFVKGVEEIGGEVAATPAVASLVGTLRPLLDTASQLELGKLGPGAAGWAGQTPADAGGSIVFKKSLDGREHQIEFVRVPPAGGSGEDVSFMATSELSVGLFIDLVTAAGKWDDVRSLLSAYPAGGDDSRRGPRVWEWSVKPGEVMKVSEARPNDSSRGWYRFRPWLTQQQCYAEGLTVTPPTREQPMQFVSPAAAIYVARLAGCRIPTPQDWKGGFSVSGDGSANLRDQTWKRQYEHTKKLAAGSPEWPSGGIFWPTGATKVQPHLDGNVSVESDDGELWFVPVGSGTGTGPYRHLKGNVAEFVFDDARMIEALGAPEADRVKSLLGRGEKLHVVGGSALSSREHPAEQVLNVSLSQAIEGFSDVGFRLAFSAPKSAAAASIQERLKVALDATGYLPGGR